MINREFEHATLCRGFGHCNAFSMLSLNRDTRHCSCFCKVAVFSAKNYTADRVAQNRHISRSVEFWVDYWIMNTKGQAKRQLYSDVITWYLSGGFFINHEITETIFSVGPLFVTPCLVYVCCDIQIKLNVQNSNTSVFSPWCNSPQAAKISSFGFW